MKTIDGIYILNEQVMSAHYKEQVGLSSYRNTV